MEQTANGFQQFITGDESWFFLYYPRDSVWAAPHDEFPQCVKQKTDTEKCLVSILCSVNEIPSLLVCPKGQHTTQHSSLMLLCSV
jgi:hypothetical protein